MNPDIQAPDAVLLTTLRDPTVSPRGIVYPSVNRNTMEWGPGKPPGVKQPSTVSGVGLSCGAAGVDSAQGHSSGCTLGLTLMYVQPQLGNLEGRLWEV